MAYEPEPEQGDEEEHEAPDIHTLKKNFELLHTSNQQSKPSSQPLQAPQRVDERPKLSNKQIEERKKAEEEKRRRDLR